jgi:hypothetical protein
MLALSMNNTNIMNSYMNTTIGLKNSNKYKNDKNVNVNQSMTNIPTTNNTNTTNTNNYASTNNPTTTTTKPDKSK